MAELCEPEEGSEWLNLLLADEAYTPSTPGTGAFSNRHVLPLLICDVGKYIYCIRANITCVEILNQRRLGLCA